MPPISVFLLHNETLGILEKEERESSSGVRPVSGRRKLHSFWIWKKESGVDEGRNPSGGERFYVSRGTDWRGSSEPGVLFMRAEWSLFFSIIRGVDDRKAHI
jgi:hypothetical protein